MQIDETGKIGNFGGQFVKKAVEEKAVEEKGEASFLDVADKFSPDLTQKTDATESGLKVNIGKAADIVFNNAKGRLYSVAFSPQWKFQAGEEGYPNYVTAGSDGMVYAGGKSGILYAINGNTGEKMWEFDAESYISSRPLIGKDKSIFFGCSNGKTYALDKDGKKKWDFDGQGIVLYPPVRGRDGTIFVCCDNKGMFALDENTGNKKWELKDWQSGGMDKFHYYRVSTGLDGMVYIEAHDCDDNKRNTSGQDLIIGVNEKTGQKEWEFRNKYLLDMSDPDPSGKIFVGCGNGKIYRLDARSGEATWEFDIGHKNFEPLVDEDGNFYVNDTHNRVFAFNKEGKKLWESSPTDRDLSMLDMGHDGTILGRNLGAGATYVFDAKTGKIIGELDTGHRQSRPSLGQDGMVFVGCNDSYLYAYKMSRELEGDLKESDGGQKKGIEQKIEKGKDFINIGGVVLEVRKDGEVKS